MVPVDPHHVVDPQDLLELLEGKIKRCIELMGGPNKYHEFMNRTVVDQVRRAKKAS